MITYIYKKLLHSLGFNTFQNFNRSLNKRQMSAVVTSSEEIQQALTDLALLSHGNNIQCNASKCKVMSITRKKMPVLGDNFFKLRKVTACA